MNTALQSQHATATNTATPRVQAHHSPAAPSRFIGSQMQCGLALNMANARLSIALTRWRGRGAITASSHSTACILLGEYLPIHQTNQSTHNLFAAMKSMALTVAPRAFSQTNGQAPSQLAQAVHARAARSIHKSRGLPNGPNLRFRCHDFRTLSVAAARSHSFCC